MTGRECPLSLRLSVDAGSIRNAMSDEIVARQVSCTRYLGTSVVVRVGPWEGLHHQAP